MSALHAWPDDTDPHALSRSPYQRRKSPRAHNPKLAITVRGRLFETVNWSLSGILIEAYDGALAPGEEFEIEQAGPAGQRMWPVMIRARVVRLDGTRMAARFLTFSVAAYDILEGMMLRRLNMGQGGAA